MGHFTVFATLALLVGAAAASIGFKSGHEYDFKYTAVAASGIPSLKNQFAGALLVGQVKFQRQNEQEVYMKIERLQAIELNGPVPTGSTEKLLRDLQKEAKQTAQETVELTQVAPALQKAVRVQYENGRIRGFEVSRECPEWAVNIQKGILSLAMLRLDEQEKGSGLEKINRLVKESSDAFINYAVMEDGVDGKCESTYSVSSENWEANPTEQVLNVTKIRNMNKCNERPQFTLQTLQDQDCQKCEAQKTNVLTQLAVVKYNLRGNRQSFEFERIESQGQMVFAPYTSNAEVFLTNTSRLLELRQKQPIQHQLQAPSDAKAHHTLQYQFPSAAEHKAEQLNNGQFDVRKAPPTPFTPRGEKKASAHHVAQLVEEIAQAIRANQEQPEQQISKNDVLSKSLTAKRLMRMLDFQEVEQVYQQAQRSNDKVAKRVAQDIMVMAGTAPCIMVLKKAIETEQIRGEEAALILQQIPTTVYTPHYVLIEEFAKLTKCEAAKRDSQIYSTAWLSFGSLVSIACNGTGNTRETPSYVDDNAFCPEEIKQRFMKELEQELRKVQGEHWRQIVMIQAIGNTLAPEAAEILKPYIAGKATDCPVLRSKAIYAMNGCAKLKPRKAIKILAPIFFNQQEMPEVRIAALSMLVTAHPEHQFLSKIAAQTWTERSQQVGSFVYSTLKNLAEASHPCLEDLKNDAKLALELANKDFSGNGMDSKAFLHDNSKMSKYNMHNTLQASWVNSNESMVPTAATLKLNRTESGYNYNVMQAFVNLKGLDEVINRIAGPKSAFYQIEKLSDLFRSEDKEAHKGLRQIIEALNIDTESRQTTDFMFNLYVKMFDTQARNFYISKETIKNFLSGSSQSASAKFFEELIFGNGVHVNYNKIFNTEERLVKLPTPVGLPVIISTNKPVFVQIRGEAKVEIDNTRNPNSIVPVAVRVSVNGRPVVAQKKVTTMGIALPFSKKYAAVGVSRDIKASIPINAQVSIDLSEGKLTAVAGRQGSAARSNGNAPVLHYKVTPFTTLAHVFEAKPISKQQGAKLIRIQEQPKQMQKEYLTKTLGLPVIVKCKTEEKMTSGASFIDQALEKGIWNLMNQWDQPMSLKAREYTVELHTESAETREAQFSVAFEFTPAPHQRALKNREYTPNTLWSYLAGWSDLPMPCKPATELNREQYADEESQYSAQRQYNRQQGYSSSEEDSSEQADQEERQEERESRRFRSQSESESRKQQHGSFWRLWANQKSSRNNAQDDSSEENRSAEYDNQSAEYTGKNTWNTRRSSAQSSAARRQQQAANRAMRYSAKNDRTQYESRDEQDRNQAKLNVQKVNIADNVPQWKIVFKAQTVGGQERSVQGVIAGKRNLAQLKDSIKAEIKLQHPKLQNQLVEICAEAVAQYPAVPCSYDHTFDPRAIGPILAEAKATWGAGACSSSNYVEVQAKIGKSGKQLHQEQQAKPWYYKQCMEERKKGLKFEEACSQLYDEITALNKIDLNIKYNNLPLALKNATHKVDQFAKAYLYTHMSNDAVTGQNEPKQVRIVVEFEQAKPHQSEAQNVQKAKKNKNTVNIKIQKPTETTIFTEVKTPLAPLSAHRSVAKQVADAVTGRQYPATCDISGGKYVDTFNNLTYKHDMGQCTYLAARDCSPNGLFAVLVSGPQSPKSGAADGIFVEVRLLKNQIKLAPSNANMNQYHVTINGEKHELTQGETLIADSGKQAPGTPDALAYITLVGHFVHVKAPAHGVEIKFDGKDVRIQTSYFYAGKMCGLCGPFDGDSKDEFVSPQGCVFAEAQDFAESYIVPDGQCQNRKHQNRQVCKSKDESTATYPQLESNYDDAEEYEYSGRSSSQSARHHQQSHHQRQQHKQQQSQESYSSQEQQQQRGQRNSASCSSYRNQVINGKQGRAYHSRMSDRLTYSSAEESNDYSSNNNNQGNSDEQTIDQFELQTDSEQICFSTEPVLKCKSGCQATHKQTRTVRFHCLNRNDYAAKELLRKQPHQSLDELEGKRADFTKEVQVPAQCQSTY